MRYLRVIASEIRINLVKWFGVAVLLIIFGGVAVAMHDYSKEVPRAFRDYVSAKSGIDFCTVSLSFMNMEEQKEAAEFAESIGGEIVRRAGEKNHCSLDVLFTEPSSCVDYVREWKSRGVTVACPEYRVLLELYDDITFYREFFSVLFVVLLVCYMVTLVQEVMMIAQERRRFISLMRCLGYTNHIVVKIYAIILTLQFFLVVPLSVLLARAYETYSNSVMAQLFDSEQILMGTVFSQFVCLGIVSVSALVFAIVIFSLKMGRHNRLLEMS